MPSLTLKFKENIIGTFSLAKGESLTIGRHRGNDIVIENLGASGHHAKIDSLDDSCLFTDLGSTNGSFVNKKLVSSHRLKRGDIITIAKHDLVFAYEEGESEPEDAASLLDKTMIMDTEQQREMLAKSDAAAPGGVKKRKSVAVLSFLAGNKGEVVLSKKLTKIGKASDSDIVVRGFTVGKTAATISKRPNGYYLSYVGGMSKPKVNKTAVTESVKLNEFDVIEIGSAKVQFIFQD